MLLKKPIIHDKDKKHVIMFKIIDKKNTINEQDISDFITCWGWW